MPPSLDNRQAAFPLRWERVGWVLLALATGCTSPASQLRQCQQEKDQLLAAIRQQRETATALRQQVASLEERLDQAEKELARSGSPSRLSSRPTDRPPASAPSTSAETLPWRPPADRLPPTEQAPAAEKKQVRPAASTAPLRSEPAPRPLGQAANLRQLLARDPRCAYDPQVGAFRIRLPLTFREGTTLTAESKQHLDDLARWLKREELRDVRVLIAGYAEGRPVGEGSPRPATARELGMAQASAVADYLDRHGIAHERLGVTAVGSRGPWGQTTQSQGATGAVQIFLLPPETPVIGWGPTGQALRR